MSKRIVDLGLRLVNEEIDTALELYPDESYKKAFAIPELRQRLVDYVMAGIPEAYICNPDTPNPSKFPYHSLELRLRVEQYVHWGIEYILETHADLGEGTLPKIAHSSYPSNYLATAL
ncbi:hypothetical protein IQ258_07255 [Coleofasciculus sp. LEGE 07081]|nr:hypothetical protein [Coleofasciculus sp. LEGE 07081]MBE9125963.1 hypothetical protein [Coleofasciculus sp. LEGE 07081]